MSKAINTRCKFRVVGVEDTENLIYVTVHSKTPGYDELTGYEYPDQAGGKCKQVATGAFAQNVRLAASYDTSNPEDVSFAAATPSGKLEIYVSNPSVIGTFRPGQNYYLELIPCN